MSTGLFRALGMMVAWGVTTSCGGSPTAPQATASQAKEAAAPVVTVPAPQGANAPLPLTVDTLVDLVPRDAVLVANIPRLDELIAGVPPEAREAVLSGIVAGFAQKSELPPELARGLLESFDGATAFVGGESALRESTEQLRKGCVAVRFRDAGQIRKWLATPRVHDSGEGRFVLQNDERAAIAHGAWLANARIALVCAEPAPLSRSLRVAGGGEASFKSSALVKPERAKDAWIAIDLHRFNSRDAGLEPASRLFASVPVSPGAGGLDVELAAYGPKYPRLGTVLAATNHATLAKLPAGAISALGLSLQRSPGKTIRDVLNLFDGLIDARAEALAGIALGEIGLTLDDLDKALGGGAAIGFYLDPAHKLSAENLHREDIQKHGAILAVLATADDTAQKKVFGAISARAKRQAKKFTVTAGMITQDLGDGYALRVESRQGFVVLGVGEKKYLGQTFARFGKEKEALAASASFTKARSQAQPTQHLLAYLEASTLKNLVGSTAASAPNPVGLAPTMLSITLKRSDRGLELALSSHGGIEVIGAAAGLAIYGIRQYVANVKVSEAKNTVGAISRAAAAAFERAAITQQLQPNTQPAHQLCKSARPVPSVVPGQTRYTPSSTRGQDFLQGDDTTGWHCLRFLIVQPIHYQYDYRAGGGYKGPARGGPDPGKDGFEASAEGDLDGDGKTSLFTRTGKVMNGQLVLSPQMFISDESE